MAVLLAMLRGVNVGGKKVPMAELRELYSEMKLENVRTYIQSGNVIFESKEDNPEKLAAQQEKKIKATFGFDVPVVIRNKKELGSVIKGNPFLNEKNIAEERLYVTFLKEMPSKELLEKITVPSGTSDRFEIIGKEIYLYCPGGYGETKLNNNFFEKKLKVDATTRNWRSTNELFKMMQE
ncbi:MAG: hypothetical protein K0Q95_1292 [Bacteroidota bacterium]|jgi:uncharacterized protein (DUF1697 family)|nr:hypothetical protein [Bacteroidota bacterium]